MVGTDDAPMFMIQDKFDKVWAVKQVPDTKSYMVGIQRKFHESNGILYGTLLMPTYIEGMHAMCFEHLVRAGWTKGKVPNTPFPKEQLTLHDTHNLLTDEEVERVQKRGFRSIKGQSDDMGREKLLSGVQVWGLSDCEGNVSAIRNCVGTPHAYGCMDVTAQAQGHQI